MRSIFSGGKNPVKETDPAALAHMNVASVRRARVANYGSTRTLLHSSRGEKSETNT